MTHRWPKSALSTQEIEAAARESSKALALVADAEATDRRALENGYRFCAACRVRLVAAELCSHHTIINEQERVAGWAAGNRIWCEFVHGKWPARRGSTSAPTGEDPRHGSDASRLLHVQRSDVATCDDRGSQHVQAADESGPHRREE